MSSLNHGILNELRVPVPPIEEQRSITATFGDIKHHLQRLQSIYRRKLAALDELKKSLLHQAFSGAL